MAGTAIDPVARKPNPRVRELPVREDALYITVKVGKVEWNGVIYRLQLESDFGRSMQEDPKGSYTKATGE